MTEGDRDVNLWLVIALSEQTIIDRLIEGLMRKYPAVPPDTVASVVRGVHARFDGRPLRDYVPRASTG